MNILDWITDGVVTAWEFIGLIFRSGITEAAILQQEESDNEGTGRGARRDGYPSTSRSGVHQAHFA